MDGLRGRTRIILNGRRRQNKASMRNVCKQDFYKTVSCDKLEKWSDREDF